jgi:hypothetical protein
LLIDRQSRSKFLLVFCRRDSAKRFLQFCATLVLRLTEGPGMMWASSVMMMPSLCHLQAAIERDSNVPNEAQTRKIRDDTVLSAQSDVGALIVPRSFLVVLILRHLTV